jgi:hypothetical protein
VRWYLRYPLAYEHVSELLAERGLAVDASCIWRWVQAYAGELNKRCRPHAVTLFSVTLFSVMANPQNPFIFGEIIDEPNFVDRENELAQLVRDLADG